MAAGHFYHLTGEEPCHFKGDSAGKRLKRSLAGTVGDLSGENWDESVEMLMILP